MWTVVGGAVNVITWLALGDDEAAGDVWGRQVVRVRRLRCGEGAETRGSDGQRCHGDRARGRGLRGVRHGPAEAPGAVYGARLNGAAP